MSEDDQIIESVLANFTEYDPADPNDPTAWHFTDCEVRSLLVQCIERTREAMLDPIETGKQIGRLALQRDETRQDALRMFRELYALHEASMKLRNVLVKCSQVGWPVDVQQAFYEWQGLLAAPESNMIQQENENNARQDGTRGPG